MDVYENPQTLSEYLIFHYGTEDQLLPYGFGPRTALGFPVRCVRHLAAKGGDAVEQAYDLGCAVGRSTFELGHYARNVKGVDLSSTFIAAARSLLGQGRLATEILVEGEIAERLEVTAPEVAAGTTICFEVGDAVELARKLPPADIVLAANLLCRLPTPRLFLEALPRLVRPKGQLLLVTPFTWLEAFTPRSEWPRDRAGNAMLGADWIAEVLGRDFVLEHAEDLPFLIREHARKFQWTVSYGMRWRRR
jgi:SAM-dependent methyltransferase